MTDLVTRLLALADDITGPSSAWAQTDVIDDALREAAAEALAKLAEAATYKAEMWRLNEQRKDERDEARAEAVALREALYLIGHSNEHPVEFVDIARRALSQPGLGAALLERVKKLEAVAVAARAVEQRMGMGELDDLAKALAALDAKEGT